MNSLPCQGCKGLCCGPVPVSEKEVKTIKKKIQSMPAKIRNELQGQQRYYGTCIFYDLDKDRCGIHAVRPDICRKFGYYKELVCFRKPELATHSLDQESSIKYVGLLTIDFTWNDFK